MTNDYFQALENQPTGTARPLAEVLQHLTYNDQGLIPVIAQDSQTNVILMHAWMNEAALSATLASKKMTYWSRSRNQLWVKGETSGHIQIVDTFSMDCDGDTLLFQVTQHGPACHTTRPNCFYLSADLENQTVYIATEQQDTELKA